MKSKILCFVFIFSLLFSVFCLTSFADDDITPYADYDAPTDLTGTVWYIPSGWSTVSGYGQFNVTGTITGNDYINRSFAFMHLGYYGNYSETNGILFGGVFQTRNTSLDFTLTFTGGTDSGNSSLISWLMQYGVWTNPPDPTPVPLYSGYYRLVLPIDIEQPTWIGDRNTVWYDIRGRVVTEYSNRALSFHRLGISYFVNEGADYGAGVWGLEIRVDTNTDTNLEILSITYDRNTEQFYWAYNDLVLDGFVGLAIDGNYEVIPKFKLLFDDIFEPYDYVYTGNPWYDIVDGVVDALKIDVFGDFSPWDILITFIGITVFIWLLKLLAGG